MRSTIRVRDAAKRRDSSGENSTSWRKRGRSAFSVREDLGISHGDGHRVAAEAGILPGQEAKGIPPFYSSTSGG